MLNLDFDTLLNILIGWRLKRIFIWYIFIFFIYHLVHFFFLTIFRTSTVFFIAQRAYLTFTMIFFFPTVPTVTKNAVSFKITNLKLKIVTIFCSITFFLSFFTHEWAILLLYLTSLTTLRVFTALAFGLVLLLFIWPLG